MMGRWVVTNEWSMILKVLLGNVRIVSSGRSIKKKKGIGDPITTIHRVYHSAPVFFALYFLEAYVIRALAQDSFKLTIVFWSRSMHH